MLCRIVSVREWKEGERKKISQIVVFCRRDIRGRPGAKFLW